MYTQRISEGQTIFDLAIQEYGDPSAVFKLMADNPGKLPDLEADPQAGDTFQVREEPEVANKDVMNYFRTSNIHVNTGTVETHNTGLGYIKIVKYKIGTIQPIAKIP